VEAFAEAEAISAGDAADDIGLEPADALELEDPAVAEETPAAIDAEPPVVAGSVDEVFAEAVVEQAEEDAGIAGYEPAEEETVEAEASEQQPWEVAAAAFVQSLDDDGDTQRDAMKEAISAALADQDVPQPAEEPTPGIDASWSGPNGSEPQEDGAEAEAVPDASPVILADIDEAREADDTDESRPPADVIPLITAVDLGDEPSDDLPAEDALAGSEDADAASGQWPWDVPESALDEAELDDLADEAQAQSDPEADIGAVASVPSPPPLGAAVASVVEPLGIQEAAVSGSVAVAAVAEDVADPALDLHEYTCDDCVYVNTCPNQHQKAPTECGSFQWKSL
jgi:hypothetical protein